MQAVAPADLEGRVREVATRAFWDSVQEATASGDYSALFSVLGEMQQSMRALIAHSAQRLDEMDDKFDAKWIEQQAEAGCLTTELVQGLIRFLVRKISS